MKKSLSHNICAQLNRPVKFIFSALPFAALFLGSACTLTPQAQPEVTYQCNRGTALSVIFKEIPISKIRGGRNAGHSTTQRVQSALITLSNGNTLELSAQNVASGFMVSNGRYTLRGKGSEALWTVGRMAEEKCAITSQ